ncbi:hypothetical protein HZS38_07220 [Xenorhabdus nematophila]|uniref:Uncharacterized protein n=1 Tax=Xenorhabdus nematophila (strain ATCC 19061 / DSM 3370 / CCUG 14189 / LMG 1036 / NCIMB 9965 / AN6) TaxID=406817 RepID=D3VFC4_XENNA|nr:hypothetical protein [Xenorhabdus nematophila]CEE93230.1 hypothetical protein; putative exported protein [Xenorhabdus nematophila str. Anatoliense]CEF29451.1 hypothetical protein; putative exported protein [Xenorhabdus nematophila str. Websteri]AYA40282.1 hypothetical protein D3790_07300 [Xenorhabdus nematophila]KHD29065.1 hypothetical protein LH67_05490 [Xenorhabdus nematophila]MBA0018951.1 hypothetical protein [Xenorhabdus nematophila]
MINKKMNVLAGLFLSLITGVGVAAEKAVTGSFGVVSPDNFHCTKVMTSGNYIGKLDYIISLEHLSTSVYWFTGLESNDVGCISVDASKTRHASVVHDAFIQGKTVKVKLEGHYVKAIVY